MNKRFLLALALFTLPAWASDGNPRKRNHTVVTFTQEELDKATPPRRADDDDYRNIYGCNRKQEESCLIASIVTLSGAFLWLTTTQKSTVDAAADEINNYQGHIVRCFNHCWGDRPENGWFSDLVCDWTCE